MNKIKYDLIHRIYDDTTLTSDELNMIIYLAKNGDDLGSVRGIYYKEYARELRVSHAQFYNILNSLEEKGYIIKEKNYREDIDVCLTKNIFVVPGEDYEPVAEYRDYLNLNMKLFEDAEFYELRVYAKKLLLALLVKAVNDKARRQKVGIPAGKTYSKVFHVPLRQYDIYAEKLHITKRMAKSYFREIKKWVSTYNDSLYTDTDIITVQENAVGKPEISVSERGKTAVRKKTDRFDSDLTFIKMLCRRHRVESDDTGLTDAAQLVSQYDNGARKIGQNIRSIAERAVKAAGGTLSAAGLNRYINSYIANASENMLRNRLCGSI